MVHAFFDETGTPSAKDGVFGIAGFIASDKRWNAFAPEWAAALRNAGLVSLHTTDFLANQGQHRADDFDLAERLDILRGFAGIIRKHAYGAFAVTVDCAAFREVPKDSPKHATADVFCMMQVIANIHKVMREIGVEQDAVECYFDQSEKYSQRMLSAWLELRKRKKGIPRHLLASISFGDSTFVPALQAADMLSCGLHRELRASPENTWLSDSPFRLMIEGPDKDIPFELHQWSAEEMIRRRADIQAAVANNG